MKRAEFIYILGLFLWAFVLFILVAIADKWYWWVLVALVSGLPIISWIIYLGV